MYQYTNDLMGTETGWTPGQNVDEEDFWCNGFGAEKVTYKCFFLLPPSRSHLYPFLHFSLLPSFSPFVRCSCVVFSLLSLILIWTSTSGQKSQGNEMMNKGFFGQLLCCFRPNQVPPTNTGPTGTNGSSLVHTETDYFSKVRFFP